MPSHFNLIVITPEKDIPGESEIINRLFEIGLQTLHIRKYNHTRKEIIDFISSISSKFHHRVVIHQHYDMLNEFELKGAHISENRRLEYDNKGIKNIVSTSFHKLSNITRETAKFEYAFLSPIYRSISKKDHESSLDMPTLKAFLHSDTPFPVIALGGIDEKTILQAKEIGFNGAACIGYIWEYPDPVAQYTSLQKIVGN